MIKRRKASLLKKLLDRKPFKKRLERKLFQKKFYQKRMESENDIIGVINRRNASLLKKGLSENLWQRRDKPAQRLCLSENFFKKSLIKNGELLDLRTLAPNPIRRDKPAQRFQHNGFGTTVGDKLLRLLNLLNDPESLI